MFIEYLATNGIVSLVLRLGDITMEEETGRLLRARDHGGLQ